MSDTGQYDDQFAEAIRDRDALAAMLACAGWELVNTWLQEEIDKRRCAYEEGAPHSMNDASIIGFQRAQLGMLRTLQDMPAMLMKSHQDAIDQIQMAEGAYDAADQD